MDIPYGTSPSSDEDVSNVCREAFTTGGDVSDVSLVRRAQSGESRAFDRLMVRYRTRVVALALRYTRNPADAEDATQETFMRAYRGLRRFRCESAFYTWLYRIATNCARSLLRARVPDSRNLTIDCVDDPNADNPSPRLQELETPEGLALAEEIRWLLNAIFDGLSEEHRTVITLREIDGLSYKEIASAMSIPVGTVRSRVLRARERIDLQLRRVHDCGLGRHSI
jgi:RNA polymerase sigma-70 factor (ECF subfamily)